MKIEKPWVLAGGPKTIKKELPNSAALFIIKS